MSCVSVQPNCQLVRVKKLHYVLVYDSILFVLILFKILCCVIVNTLYVCASAVV